MPTFDPTGSDATFTTEAGYDHDARIFTRDHADAALVYLKPIVRDIRDHYRRVVQLRELLATASYSQLPAVEADYDRHMRRLGDLVDELHDAGVELRDFEGGLLAFASRCDGVPVTLLWQADSSTPFGLPLPARRNTPDHDGVTHMLFPGAPLCDATPLPRAA